MTSMCFWGLLFPSNFTSYASLKFSSTGAPQISSERGREYTISSSSLDVFLLLLLKGKDFLLQNLIGTTHSSMTSLNLLCYDLIVIVISVAYYCNVSLYHQEDDRGGCKSNVGMF